MNKAGDCRPCRLWQRDRSALEAVLTLRTDAVKLPPAHVVTEAHDREQHDGQADTPSQGAHHLPVCFGLSDHVEQRGKEIPNDDSKKRDNQQFFHDGA